MDLETPAVLSSRRLQVHPGVPVVPFHPVVPRVQWLPVVQVLHFLREVRADLWVLLGRGIRVNLSIQLLQKIQGLLINFTKYKK